MTAQQFENSSYMWGGSPGASVSATGTLVLEDASASLTIQMQALNTEIVDLTLSGAGLPSLSSLIAQEVAQMGPVSLPVQELSQPVPTGTGSTAVAASGTGNADYWTVGTPNAGNPANEFVIGLSNNSQFYYNVPTNGDTAVETIQNTAVTATGAPGAIWVGNSQGLTNSLAASPYPAAPSPGRVPTPAPSMSLYPRMLPIPRSGP